MKLAIAALAFLAAAGAALAEGPVELTAEQMDTVTAGGQAHVGDLPELGLTGLTFVNDYRPTVRYDYDLAGFGTTKPE